MDTTVGTRFAGEDPGRYSPRLEIRRCRARQLTGRQRSVEPVRSLLVCTNPRAGSWMLCTALAQTSVAGYPSEYLIPWDEKEWSALWGARDYEAFLAGMRREGTSANGLFSVKLMWGHVEHLRDRVRELDAYRALDAADLLPAVFPEPTYVWLSRRDTVAQAVSHARAVTSGTWAVGAAERPDAPPDAAAFDPDLVRRLHTEVLEQEEAWRRLFASRGVEPLRLWYEDLVADFDGCLRRVLAHAGLDWPATARPPRPRVARQSAAGGDPWLPTARRLLGDAATVEGETR
ncbi:Stf0 family sulfotransferase [Streptomyces sp. B6B3]|uniref:Stf0 family sulfotransferase n=1 Tax=Streptomyces sp. B6B3 TaxID=3153570 RepID=UPI00325C9C35